MATQNTRSVSAECEICGTETYGYSIWRDVEDNTMHYGCGEYHCETEFESVNFMEYLGDNE